MLITWEVVSEAGVTILEHSVAKPCNYGRKLVTRCTTYLLTTRKFIFSFVILCSVPYHLLRTYIRGM